ncbi:MAG: Asp/Glu racemase [Proteobacteria bacterium]|nr:Asp/Glu racemase [Pseudomonadota bacterium]
MEIVEAVPHEIDNIIARRARIGLIALATDHVIDHELARLLGDIAGVQLYTTRVPMEAQVSRNSLAAMESRLGAAATTLLPGVPLDVIGYGCTSASVVIGEDKVAAAIHGARPGVQVTTPITAGLAALASLGAKRIGLLTPYVEEVNAPLRAYFIDRGITIDTAATFSEPDDNKAGMITPASIRRAVVDLFKGKTLDAVFISCTSLRAATLVPELEATLGHPVTTSNHALAWHLLRLSGVDEAMPAKGKLYELGLSAPI